jgi:hypothetical protein
LPYNDLHLNQNIIELDTGITAKSQNRNPLYKHRQNTGRPMGSGVINMEYQMMKQPVGIRHMGSFINLTAMHKRAET